MDGSSSFNFNCNWISNLKELPNLPSFLIANEFFDALPIKQIISKDGLWYNHEIFHKDKNLFFGIGKLITDSNNIQSCPDNTIIEFCPSMDKIIQDIIRLISNFGNSIALNVLFPTLNISNTKLN